MFEEDFAEKITVRLARKFSLRRGGKEGGWVSLYTGPKPGDAGLGQSSQLRSVKG